MAKLSRAKWAIFSMGKANLNCLEHICKRVRLWSGRPEIQISGRSNQTQCCQKLATDATFLQKEQNVACRRNDAEIGPVKSLHASV